MLSPQTNNTGYLYNGFDDLGTDGQPASMIALNRVQTPSQVILLAPKAQGATQFYADLLSASLANLLSEFNPAVYDGGASYLFVDGSVRFLKQADYSNDDWLADKSVQLPPLPSPFNSHNGFARTVRPGPLCPPELLGAANWR